MKISVKPAKIGIKIKAQKIYPELEDLEVTPSGVEQNFKSEKYGYDNVKVKAINLQDKAITLNENGIYNIKADEEYSGLNNVKVTLDAIEDLDAELNTYESELNEQETKIEDIMETLKNKGVIGAEELNVIPTKDEQVIEGIYNKVNVAGDEDLLPENIKDGVNIFGVEGTGKMATAKITNVTYLFFNNERIDYLYEILDLCENLTSTANMFYRCTDLTELDLSGLDISNSTDASNMFLGCSFLENINFGNFNINKIEDMEYMFYGCNNLKQLDLSNFDTSNVQSMYRMFESCSTLTELDLSHFNTSNVTNMGYLFYQNKSLENLNISNWDTSKNKSLNSTFHSCTSLVNLDLSSFDLSAVNYVVDAFTNCINLTNLKSFKNLGKGYTYVNPNYSAYALNLSRSSNLTYESLIDIITNGLYDLNLVYVLPEGSTFPTQKIVIGADNMAKLSAEEIAIATNKGWVVS